MIVLQNIDIYIYTPQTIDMSIEDPMRLAEKGRIKMSADCNRSDYALPLSVGRNYRLPITQEYVITYIT